MNNNLKELIEDIKYGIKNGTDREGIKIDGIGLSWNNLKLLINEIERLNNIIEKAVEYINKNCITSDKWEDLGFCNFIPTGEITYKQLSKNKINKLLNILNGRSDE